MNTQKHLIAYQISGQTIGINIETYDPANLNGNLPKLIILSGETVPDGYVNIDSIENWDRFALNIANDYSVVKFQIKEMATIIGWTGLTNTEKDLVIKYYGYPDATTAVIYLMTTKGMSQAQAQGFVLQSWHKHHLRNIKSYNERWNYAKFTVVQYLSQFDGEDLFNTVTVLISRYIKVGVLGKNYDDNDDGIIDYIFSINGFTGQGLEENNYTLLQGTWADFKNRLFDVLVHGIYNKYSDI